MIRVSANLSKKVPIPSVGYSSQQFGASLEIEVSDADQPAAIRERIQQLYSLLRQAVDEQIAAASVVQNLPVQTSVVPSGMDPVNREGEAIARLTGNPVPCAEATVVAAHDGNGNDPKGPKPGRASVAQQRAIYALTKSLGLDLGGVLTEYFVADPRDLSIREASALLDQLRQQQKAARQP